MESGGLDLELERTECQCDYNQIKNTVLYNNTILMMASSIHGCSIMLVIPSACAFSPERRVALKHKRSAPIVGVITRSSAHVRQKEKKRIHHQQTDPAIAGEDMGPALRPKAWKQSFFLLAQLSIVFKQKLD